MNQKSPKQIRVFAGAVAKGYSLQRAMLDAGYAPSTARRGRAALSQPMWEALAREWTKLELLGRKISPERQANLVRGRLVQNVITGRDDAVQSAKQLGADKRINMWQPDSQAGMVILKPPPIPKIDHEVPWIKTRFQEELELKAKSHDAEHEPLEGDTSPDVSDAPDTAAEEAWDEEERKAEK